ncbi:hypothetical protein E4U21_002740 [Claviceps maximensis]|nr:hypothetical protein E4U21_002740 [Claviceps maximensis]
MVHHPIKTQGSRLTRDLTLIGPFAAESKIPRLIYGTAWKKERTADLVYLALKSGFRGVDTAAQPKHNNEQGVAAGVKRAIAEGIIRRQDLFIQTKFTAPGGQNHITPYDLDAPLIDKVHQSVQLSLSHFTVDDGQEPYLDSLVLHAPMDTLQDTLTVWKVLESYTPKRIRTLGISNTTLITLEALYANMAVKPSVVQNRFHDGTEYDVKIRAYCREKRIVFQSFWTLSSNENLVVSKPVERVAKGAAVDVVAAYYALVLGLENLTVLDGTTDQSHMDEDLQGIEKVGSWAEGAGAEEWMSALASFKTLLADK